MVLVLHWKWSCHCAIDQLNGVVFLRALLNGLLKGDICSLQCQGQIRQLLQYIVHKTQILGEVWFSSFLFIPATGCFIESFKFTLFQLYFLFLLNECILVQLLIVLCDTWNWNDDTNSAVGIAILDTTAIPAFHIRNVAKSQWYSVRRVYTTGTG